MPEAMTGDDCLRSRYVVPFGRLGRPEAERREAFRATSLRENGELLAADATGLRWESGKTVLHGPTELAVELRWWPVAERRELTDAERTRVASLSGPCGNPATVAEFVAAARELAGRRVLA